MRLPGGKADLDFVKIVVAEEKRQKRLLTLDELILLNYLWTEREINIAEAGRLTQRGENHARHLLEALMENGLVERVKTAKQREYHLSASVYREMGRSEAYIRRRGFDEPQREQMIVHYIKTNKRITRSQTSELCRINNYQAYYLLNKLVQRGLLQQMGIGGRGAYYILSEDVNIDESLSETQSTDVKNNSKVSTSKIPNLKIQTEPQNPIQLELDL